jgi:hypothetical protein
VGSGIALLGLLGTSENADLFAHVLGFAAGAMEGLAIRRGRHRLFYLAHRKQKGTQVALDPFPYTVLGLARLRWDSLSYASRCWSCRLPLCCALL